MSKVVTRRADIDLLRAVAVLSVILFHFDVPGLQGGFLGVDIFFVISGFLITTHLREQIADNSFTFTSFYSRRIKRLMPALLFTLACTSAIALWVLPGSLLANFNESLVSTAIYVSNIYFYSQTGYFDTASHLKPLLHTWSLSVEEQFYLIWPLLILCAIRLNKLRTIIVALFCVSLLASEYFFVPGESLTFFMFPFRIFEFAIGAILSGISFSYLSHSKRAVFTILGWAMVFLSIALLDEQSRMPGLLSLPVCFGTAFIILAAQGHSRLPLHGFWLRIGLISYSAYLVHWPLVVFYKLKVNSALGLLDISILLALTFLLAEFMFRYVENLNWLTRLTNKKVKARYWPVGIVAFSVAFLLTSPSINKSMRGDEVAVAIDNTPSYKQTVRETWPEVLNWEKRDSTKKVVILGDSHSRVMAMSVGPYLTEKVFVVSDICDPLVNNSIKDLVLTEHYSKHANGQVASRDCKSFHEGLLSKLRGIDPDYIIFSERWQPETLKYLQDTIKVIKREITPNILLFGPNIEFIKRPEVLFASSVSIEQINRESKELIIDNRQLEKDIAQIARSENIYFMSKSEIVCPGGSCMLVTNQSITYSDPHHWSKSGLELYGERIVNSSVFRAFLEKRQINPDEQLYTSWYMKQDGELDIMKLADPKQLYHYAIRTQKALRNEQTLVLGDRTAVEMVGVMYLAQNGGLKGVDTLLGRCPPLLDIDGEEQWKAVDPKGKLDFLECKSLSKKVKSKLAKKVYKRIILAYNWRVSNLAELDNTLNLLNKKYDVEVVLAGIKPRVYKDNGKNRLVLLKALNQKLIDVSARNGTYYFDTSRKMCPTQSVKVCFDELSSSYEAPNSLNLLGVKNLAAKVQGNWYN